MFRGCRFALWADISASKIVNYLAGLKYRGEKLSVQTYNHYLQSIKDFCQWMVQDARADKSPLDHLKSKTVTEKKHERRCLEPDEIRRLLEATEAAPERYGMTGHERALLYRLAVETGLRANELRSLKVSSFDFKNKTVTVVAGYTKNKQVATLPLRADTIAELKNFFTGKMPAVKAFGGRYQKLTHRTAEMLRSDLADAGIPYQDDTGRYFDFHALRHEAGTLLAATGVHPKVAQSLMRHSDINLTMSRYTHTLRGQESKAVAALPDLSLPSKKKQQMAATGTDNFALESHNDNKQDNKLTTPHFSENPQGIEKEEVMSGAKEIDKPLIIHWS